MEPGDIESEWRIFSASIADTVSLSCGRKVSVASRDGNPPNPVVIGSKSHCQGEEGVLLGHVALWNSLNSRQLPADQAGCCRERQKNKSGRSSGKPWKIGQPQKNSGKPSSAFGVGKQFSVNTIYSAAGDLLMSTGDIVGRNEYFEELLNPLHFKPDQRSFSTASHEFS